MSAVSTKDYAFWIIKLIFSISPFGPPALLISTSINAAAKPALLLSKSYAILITAEFTSV